MQTQERKKERLVVPTASFHGKWICVTPGEAIRNSLYYFRREFDVKDPEGVTIRISAEHRYRLYVNGVYAGCCQMYTLPYYKSFDVRDIGTLLKSGRNCIAVEVILMPMLSANCPQPGLLFDILDAKGNPLCVSDERCKGMLSPSYEPNTAAWPLSHYRIYQEAFDARREPVGWKLAGFDDSGWRPCSVHKGYDFNVYPEYLCDEVPVGGRWNRMVEREIPFMDESQTLYAQKIISIQEHLDIEDRVTDFSSLKVDLAHKLSQPGRPLKYAKAVNVQALCEEEGETWFSCSTDHFDREFDGMYFPSVLLDFGKVINAYPVLVVDGEPGAQIEIGFAERLVDGYFILAMECPCGGSYTLRGGMEEIYIPQCWQCFRYVRVQVRNCFQGLRIKRFCARLSRYPYEERGQFLSSNEKYNKLFDLCRYTIDLCTNEWLMDTPHREQGQFLGDISAVTLGGIYACFGETKMVSKYLRQCAESQVCCGLLSITNNLDPVSYTASLADYSLEWVIALWEHYLYTGEEIWIHRHYPQVIRVIEFFMIYLDEQGLVNNVAESVFIDWSRIDRRGEIAAINALLYGALKVVCKMAEFKHDDYMLGVFRETMEGIRRGFEAAFYDPERHCIVDSRWHGVQSENVNESAAGAALCYGLLSEDVAEDVIRAMYVDKAVDYVRCEPFFSWFVLRGLTKYGRFDLAMEIIRNRYIRLMVDRGETSATEEWGRNGSWRFGDCLKGKQRTLSHAWSASPAEFFLKVLPGIEILQPGGGCVRVKPHHTDFDYELTYPLVAGNVYVSCHNGVVSVAADTGVQVEQ